MSMELHGVGVAGEGQYMHRQGQRNLGAPYVKLALKPKMNGNGALFLRGPEWTGESRRPGAEMSDLSIPSPGQGQKITRCSKGALPWGWGGCTRNSRLRKSWTVGR